MWVETGVNGSARRRGGEQDFWGNSLGATHNANAIPLAEVTRNSVMGTITNVDVWGRCHLDIRPADLHTIRGRVGEDFVIRIGNDAELPLRWSFFPFNVKAGCMALSEQPDGYMSLGIPNSGRAVGCGGGVTDVEALGAWRGQTVTIHKAQRAVRRVKIPACF